MERIISRKLLRHCALPALLGLLLLAGCLPTAARQDKLLEYSRNFSEAMRWHDFSAAACHLDPTLRDDFLEQFKQARLQPVSSEIVARSAPTAEAAELTYELQFYQLPSVRIRSWQWQQQWHFKTAADGTKPRWMVTGPVPPPLP